RALRGAPRSERDARASEIPARLLGPAAVGPRARGARVEDLRDADGAAEGPLRGARGEAAHTDHERGHERPDDRAKRGVAALEQRIALAAWELVRREVPSPLFEEEQRAIVHDEEALEERLGRAEGLLEQPPEPRAAHLHA